MNAYLISMYIFIGATSYWGQVSKHYKGNLLQQLGLGLAAAWCIWRAWLLFCGGIYGHPHEPFIVTFFALISAGTIQKTATYCRRNRRLTKLRKIRAGVFVERKTALERAVDFFKGLVNKFKRLISRAKQRK